MVIVKHYSTADCSYQEQSSRSKFNHGSVLLAIVNCDRETGLAWWGYGLWLGGIVFERGFVSVSAIVRLIKIVCSILFAIESMFRFYSLILRLR